MAPPKKPKPMITPKKSETAPFTFTEQELIDGLNDPRWRLTNLYKIVDTQKRVVIFRPNREQQYLLNNLFYRNLIIKARKLGMSTAIQLLMLDTALFSANESCRVVAQDLGIAESIFRDVMKFAYDRIPEPLKIALPTDGEPSKSRIEFRNGSAVEVSTNARGTTPTFLHVSEFGKIAAKDPGKSREIITGSITAVAQNGLIFVESTAEGQSGDFYDMVQVALKTQQSGRPLYNLDFKLFFMGWWQNPINVAPPEAVVVPVRDQEYFDAMEQQIGEPITPEQRAWYVSFRENTYMGDQERMWQEMPSTIEEAFKVSMEGAYFRDQFVRIRKEQRIGKVPYDPHFPVCLFFDIGANDQTAIWFIQPKRTHFGVINYLEASGEPYSYFVNEVDKLNYVLGYVYLPHDANHRRQGAERNLTPEEMLQSVAPHWRFMLIARTPDKIMAITQGRNFLNSCVFDEEHCALGLKRLEAYRKSWNPRTGTWRNTPKEGPEENGADAFLQAAQANAAGLFSSVGYAAGGSFGNDFGGAFAPEPNLDY